MLFFSIHLRRSPRRFRHRKWREFAWCAGRLLPKTNLSTTGLAGRAYPMNEAKRMKKAEPPSSFNQHIFFEAKSVFYGTDDGDQDGSCTEFQQFEAFHRGVSPERRDRIHLVSAVGGLYGLNLISLWRPRKMTF